MPAREVLWLACAFGLDSCAPLDVLGLGVLAHSRWFVSLLWLTALALLGVPLLCAVSRARAGGANLRGTREVAPLIG